MTCWLAASTNKRVNGRIKKKRSILRWLRMVATSDLQIAATVAGEVLALVSTSWRAIMPSPRRHEGCRPSDEADTRHARAAQAGKLPEGSSEKIEEASEKIDAKRSTGPAQVPPASPSLLSTTRHNLLCPPSYQHDVLYMSKPIRKRSRHPCPRRHPPRS